MVKNSRTLTATADGGFEIDAADSLEQVIGAIDDLMRVSGPNVDRIEFAAVSSFWHSIVGVDRNGEPTTKLFAWAETRPAQYVSQLKNALDEAKVHSRTGCPFHSSYWPAKLLWIRESFPDAYSRTVKWLSFPDFLGLKLFGNDETSLSMASGTGLFDIRKLRWDSELLSHLELNPSHFPAISEPGKTFHLNAGFEMRWQALKEVRWFPAVGDGAANNVGAGCLTESKAALMIGTSGAMRVAYEGPPPDEIPGGLWCYRIDYKRVVIGGAISDGGGLYRWLKDNLRLSEDDDAIEDLIATRKPAAHGLTFLPFLAGERSTGYNDYATGAILGLRSAHDQIDIVQAALESVAYRFADIYERLSSVLPIKEIIASGGALRESPVWTQIICDVFGIGMTLPSTREASSRGVVLLASESVGLISADCGVEYQDAAEFSANPANAEAYALARKRHEEFYRLLVENSGA